MIDLPSVMYQVNYTNVMKLFIVMIIVIVATIYSPSNYAFLNSQVIKAIVLLLIIIVLYYDIHLGLLLLTLFIIILIQVNHGVIEEAHNKVESFNVKTLVSNDSPAPTDCDYGGKSQDSMSQSHIDYTLDDKVKPYEVFVKMMTSQEHLDMASNSAILG